MTKAWPTVRLGEVLVEKKQRIGTFDASGLPLLGVSNQDGLRPSALRRIGDMSRYLRVERDWFAYNPMRINVGSIGWAETDGQTGVISPDYVVFACTERIVPRLLIEFLRHRRGLQAINGETAGSVRERLYFESLARIPFPLPPLPEQRRVVARIAELAGQIQEARGLRAAANVNTGSIVHAHATTLLRQAEQEFQILPLLDVCDFEGGSQPSKSMFRHDSAEGFVRFLQIRDYSSDDHLTYIPASSRNSMVKAHEVLVGRYGASLGKILRGKEGAYNVAMCKAVPREANIDYDYLAVTLAFGAFQQRLSEISRSAQAGFNKADLRSVRMAVPPLDTQRHIVEKLDALDTEVRSLAAQQVAATRELDALLPAILDRAFKGELV